MIKTPLSTVIGGAFWTPGATIIGSTSATFNKIIKSLFSNGEQGSVGDLNDLSTLFQDEAGTIPVTGVGQVVALVKDKSGRGNHAFQTTSGKRPILQRDAVTGYYYIETDGVDDFLVTNSIDFTTTDKMSLLGGVYTQSTALNGIILELGTNSFSTVGTFSVRHPGAQGDVFTVTSMGTIYATRNVVAAPPKAVVFSSTSHIAVDKLTLKVNGVTGSIPYQDQGVGNFSNLPLYIGMRAGTSLPFKGRIYGWVIIGRLLTDNELVVIEKEFAKRVGVTLSV